AFLFPNYCTYYCLFTQQALGHQYNVRLTLDMTSDRRCILNWTGAQSYCRTYYEDLSTITSQEEQDMLIQLSGGNQIFQWIGLYSHIQHTRNWLWSDGNSVSFTDWDKGQPNNVNGSQYCVATINKWNDYYCNYLFENQSNAFFLCVNIWAALCKSSQIMT
uniref:C-type lectin domain-containing protein n=1 Tax=Cyprinus carpio TaxID=7962 RepID=A0A8C2CHT6_CYPCA